MRSLLVISLVILWAQSPTHAREMAVYSMHIGVNAAPEGSNLPSLSFADDDAARFYAFTKTLSARSILATVLDTTSQRQHPDLAQTCITPRLANLNAAIRNMKQEMASAKATGKRVVFYFSFSGHGVRKKGDTLLALIDGHITQSWMESKILSLPADDIHLFIDACHSQGILEQRGAIKEERSAQATVLSKKEMQSLLRHNILNNYPNVGALMASSADRESHEWSVLGAGVFTHELLSALSGAADINHDGNIAYSEVAAFMSAANSAVSDPRARIDVVSHPPQINHNTPILSVSWIPNAAILEGKPAALGHFYLETNSGLRALDAHPMARSFIRLWLPPDQKIWVRSGDIEASFMSKPGQTTRFASLQYQKSESLNKRGSIATSLRKGFFSPAFGRDYYRGFVDQTRGVSVKFRETEPRVEAMAATSSWAPSIACLTGSGLALTSTAIFSTLAVQAKQDFDSTMLQKPAQEAKERMELYQAVAIASGVATVGLAIGAWILWPDASWSISPAFGDNHSAHLHFGITW